MTLATRLTQVDAKPHIHTRTPSNPLCSREHTHAYRVRPTAVFLRHSQLFQHALEEAPVSKLLRRNDHSMTETSHANLARRMRRLRASVQMQKKHFREKLVEQERLATVYHILMANHLERMNLKALRVQRRWRNIIQRRQSDKAANGELSFGDQFA